MLPQNRIRTRRDLSPPRIHLNILLPGQFFNPLGKDRRVSPGQTDFSNMSYQLAPLTFSSVNSPVGLTCTMIKRGFALRFRKAEMPETPGSA